MIRRRRECLACNYRYTTYEQVEYELLTVIKRDGRREPFTREKLMSGIRRACQKRPVAEEEIAKAVERVLESISAEYDREVPSQAIGELVMQELRRLDPVAYIRFASIYRQFEEITDFVEEAVRIASQPRPDKRQMEFKVDPEAEVAKRKDRS